MDMALLAMRSGRNQAWAETMVNLQARQLINTANAVGPDICKMVSAAYILWKI